MKIFLDFDGVLRAQGVEGSSPTRMFEYAIRELQVEGMDVRIIISSSWRETISLSDIRLFFASDISELIIGTTPVLQADWREDKPIRHQEIKSWMSEHNCSKEPWIAIDDQKSLFPTGLKNLLLIDSTKLFNARAAMNLLSMAREIQSRHGEQCGLVRD